LKIIIRVGIIGAVDIIVQVGAVESRDKTN